MYAIMGIAAVLAVAAGVIFILVAVGSLLFGKPARMRVPVPLSLGDGGDRPVHDYSMRGTFAMVLFFLAVMALFYGLDWMWLSRLWEFGG
jgi:cytochrome c oxidase subunit 1